MKRVLLWLLAAGTAQVALAAPQSTALPPGGAGQKFLQWIEAIEGHAGGQRDAAVTQIAPWSRRDLMAVLTEIKINRLKLDRQAIDGRLKRGALLHTDIAILHKARIGYALPHDNTDVVHDEDGRQIGQGGGTVHWPFSRMLLDALSEPSQDHEARRWYRATAAYLQEWRDYAEFNPHLRRGLDLFPADPVLTLYAGTMHEYYGEPRIQLIRAERIREGMARREVAPLQMEDARREWHKAEDLYREALRIDPTLSEARLRLGRVLGLQDRPAEARAELQRALSEGLAPQLHYYAFLFLGKIQGVLGNLDDARAAFEQARALEPDAQSPHLGLSQLARHRGDRAASLEALAVLSREPAVDPWWLYHRVTFPSADDQVVKVREMWKR